MLVCHDNTTGIFVPSKGIQFKPLHAGRGYAVARIGRNIGITATYFSPNKTVKEFEKYWDEVTNIARRIATREGIEMIVAGDLNAWSRLWGSPQDNVRGNIIADTIEQHDWICFNTGKTPTYRRGEVTSVIDITIATQTVASRITGWRVLEGQETMSDHERIQYAIAEENTEHAQAPNIPTSTGWNIRKGDKNNIRNALQNATKDVRLEDLQPLDALRVIVEVASTALDTATKRKGKNRRNPPKILVDGGGRQEKARMLNRAQENTKSSAETPIAGHNRFPGSHAARRTEGPEERDKDWKRKGMDRAPRECRKGPLGKSIQDSHGTPGRPRAAGTRVQRGRGGCHKGTVSPWRTTAKARR